TSAGTKKVKVLAPGPYALYPVGFTPVGRRVYFFTQDPFADTSSESLWVSDGTAAGTTVLAKFGSIFEPTALGGKLAFLASQPGGTTYALWTSNGTASGTTLIKSFPNTSVQESPPPSSDGMIALGSTLYFVGPGTGGGSSPSSLWVSDGTSA